MDFTIPNLGDGVEKADVARVMINVGDIVAVDQSVLEVETDKATVEVPSTVAGKVVTVSVKAGDKVTSGQVVFTVEAVAEPAKPTGAAPTKPTGEASTAPGGEAPTKPEGAASTTPGGEAPTKPAGKPSGEASTKPAAGSALTTPESDGAAQSREGEAPTKPVGAAPTPPKKVVDIASVRATPPPAPAKTTAGSGELQLATPVPAAPSVRRYARELGVNITGVEGSGPGGRIGNEDVKQFVRGAMGASGPSTRSASSLGAGSPGVPLPDFSKWGSVESKPMSNIRRKTAQHLSAAWSSIPHVTQNDKADVTSLEQFRKSYGKKVEAAGAKLTVTAILVKIIALAIDRFPQFASSVDMANEALIFKQYRHIGIAVDTPNGLLVPVIRDVDKKTITEIAVDIGVLSGKAREKKLGLDEMSGGVFSISNLGGIGGTSFTPIVNAPEVAILGVSRGSLEPVWQGTGFVPREMLPLSLSYDHRVIDGADAARFLRFICDTLEQPLSLYL